MATTQFLGSVRPRGARRARVGLFPPHMVSGRSLNETPAGLEGQL